MTQDALALWIQVIAVLAAIGAVVAAVLAAVTASVVAVVLGALDRRNAQRISVRDHEFQRLFREQELLQRLLENYNRGGSTDSAEASRMGSEALTLIGAIGPQRLPELWANHVDSDAALHALLDDPEMPDYKKEAIKVQLALNANHRDLRGLDLR
ncbi:hypothetical protein [Herbiconiux ginsengi]|uniref:Uncharacterized protein n=1 Tax=Herbiconiux ginsengi TaxID=381665 RepID=A0A1H3RLK8_9MICO|nr:hypothetical protein [Herbiconiux ginsengi]SDZ26556.1 hypothetical protein SAMN05216554_2906 [Herbiconiux ginsengi]